MISNCCRMIRHSKLACTSIADCSGRQATEACVNTPALQEVLPLWLQPQNMATSVQEGQTIDLSKVGIQSTQLQKSVVFVLGGPGSGKGTQCSKLVQEFGLLHLSAGDLLRAHMKSGTPDGTMVAEMIKQGQIVPSHVTISLLQKAMADSKQSKVLIDGFPRNDENRAAYETQTSSEPDFILFFDCPESVMEQRLLGRNEGRTDDNAETIRKRFKVFLESSMPVISHYERKGKVHKFHADRLPEDIYKEVRQLFVPASGL